MRTLMSIAIGLTVAVSLLVGSIGLPLGSKDKMYLPNVRNTWVEVDPKKSNEARREHFREESGSRRVEIFYEDGARGTLKYRSSGALESERYTRPDGSLRKQAVYAEDGKSTVSGIELRADDSIIWQTESLDEHRSVTTVFWRDGKTVFARRNVDRQAATMTVEQKDENGVTRLLAEHSKDAVVRQAEFDGDGRLTRERKMLGQKLKDGADVFYYRADGTLEAKQLWREQIYCEEACGQVFSFTNVHFFSADGKRLERDVEISQFTVIPARIFILNEDGSKVRLDLKLDTDKPYDVQRVYKTTRIGVDGKDIDSVETQDGGDFYSLPEKLRSDKLKFEADWLKRWETREKAEG